MMDKEIVTYTHTHTHTHTHTTITQPQKRNETLLFVTNMDGPWGYHAKWNKSDRERQILYYFTYMLEFKSKK